eukprot:m.266634 g.266634  ORF g.266634 m.266634 type:complete len:630 (-) comp68502_c0_seq1:63-1952(-)
MRCVRKRVVPSLPESVVLILSLCVLVPVCLSHQSQSQCGQSVLNDTLCGMQPANAHYVAVNTSDACCTACMDWLHCLSWSMQNKWTPDTPCHLSPTAFKSVTKGVSGCSCGTARTPPPTPPPTPPSPGLFILDTSQNGKRQVFEGVEVELMSDSIGSDNEGMPGNGHLVPDNDNTTIGVPHDLTPSEQQRFATEVLSGTRTIRLALGLFLRGLSADGKNIIGRWPSQMRELKQLQDLSGIEGWAPEYWSPPPIWKDSQSYYTGTLQSFNDSFLDQFSDAVVQDIEYLRQNGLKITWWGLQNEPNVDTQNISVCHRSETTTTSDFPSKNLSISSGANSYGKCKYSQCDYFFAFRAAATKIKKLDSAIRIHANSFTGQLGAAPVANNPETLALVDAWTVHHQNKSSISTFGNNTAWSYGRPEFTNEMEYRPGGPYAGTVVGTVGALNMYLNMLTFRKSPTGVIFIHAMKPTTNLESLGYGWTWWRSTGSPASTSFPNLKPNTFTYNYWNWPTVAPLIKTVPWNSIRLNVMEDIQRPRQRVVAFETPEMGLGGPLHATTAAKKLIVVVTNEANASFTTVVGTTDGLQRVWKGYSFHGSVDGSGFNVSLGTTPSVSSFNTTLDPYTFQWWYEQ